MLRFIKILSKKCKENELILMSNALTYKILLAIFPFIIFIMTMLGFLNIEIRDFLIDIEKTLPKEISQVINTFIEDIVYTKHIELLSGSFLITIYSASTGFSSIIQGLNRAYGLEDNRSFLRKKLTSFTLLFLFTILINIFLLIFIFKDYLIELIIKYTALEFIPYFLDSLSLYIFLAVIFLSLVILVYKISINKKLLLRHILPGAIITIVLWLLASQLFNIYINNFSKYSTIYGSIGTLFIFILWINILSFVVLLGGQINAILESMYFSKNRKDNNLKQKY